MGVVPWGEARRPLAKRPDMTASDKMVGENGAAAVVVTTGGGEGYGIVGGRERRGREQKRSNKSIKQRMIGLPEGEAVARRDAWKARRGVDECKGRSASTEGRRMNYGEIERVVRGKEGEKKEL